MHEVLMSYKLTILVDNSNCHNSVVLINLMHKCTHDHKSFSIRNDILFLILLSLLACLLLLLLTVFISFSNREWSNQKLLSINILALLDNKVLSFFLDLVLNFFYNFLLEDFNKILKNLLTHDIKIFLWLVNRQVVFLKHEFKLLLLIWIHQDINFNQTCLLILQNIQVQITLLFRYITQLMQWFLLDVFDSVTWMENVEIFLALISWLSSQETMQSQIVFHQVSDVWLCSKLLSSKITNSVQYF